MTINTAHSKTASGIRRGTAPTSNPHPISWGWMVILVLVQLLAVPVLTCASTTLGTWVPIFKGIDHATGTNTPGGGGFDELQVVQLLRVDLTDPDLQLFASPPVSNYSLGYYEAAGYTVSNFLMKHDLQVTINANCFYLPGSRDHPSYTTREGTPFSVSGLLISQGQIVSAQESAEDSAVFMFATNNTPTFVPTNWPAYSTTGIYTAVAGPYTILANGQNIGYKYLGLGGSIHGREPRTAMGVSQDRRYLYLLVVDGRQNGYSEGAYDWQTAAWLMLAGAWDGINLDGGGSTCMVMKDTAGQPLQLNKDSASRSYGRERTVGAHFGVFAKPLPGFFNDVLVRPDDTAATISWTTIEPVTSQVKYGLTTDLTLGSPPSTALTTHHAVLLTDLTGDTRYYFTLNGVNGLTEHVSAVFSFTTTNHVSTTNLFDLYNPWKFTTANLDGIPWTSPSYDDSSWDGPGPGLLWADSRGANDDIPLPLSTEMPLDPETDYPFPTYYLRTRFTFAGNIPQASLKFQSYLDDGAVFYLNGTEIKRLYMAAAPIPIAYTSLASGYGCDGNATCPLEFSVGGPLIATNLVAGDNVLAVEVHNYKANSPDITFGLSVDYSQPLVSNPKLDLTYSDGMMTLIWNQGGFTLQQADAPTGPWTDVPGPVVTSPFTVSSSSLSQFFRLRR
jgi:hypothetical protein